MSNPEGIFHDECGYMNMGLWLSREHIINTEAFTGFRFHLE